MNTGKMQYTTSDMSCIANEEDLFDELLPLKGAMVLELGCGNAAKTRILAQQAAQVLALEVDEVQLAKNKTSNNLVNVTFAYGGAQKIPAEDASVDIVMMFKSLHHVPVTHMDAAFSEIRRVLREDGLAYISEPVFDGDFNEIVRLFNDEEVVRDAAFAATKRAVSSGLFELERQKFFLQPIHFEHFGQFEEQSIKVTHSSRILSATLLEEVRARFEKHLTMSGADFQMPIRIDILKKSASLN